MADVLNALRGAKSIIGVWELSNVGSPVMLALRRWKQGGQEFEVILCCRWNWE